MDDHGEHFLWNEEVPSTQVRPAIGLEEYWIPTKMVSRVPARVLKFGVDLVTCKSEKNLGLLIGRSEGGRLLSGKCRSALSNCGNQT